MRKIHLPQNESALVDDEDYVRVDGIKWSCSKQRYTSYAIHSKKIKGTRSVSVTVMHRLIMGLDVGNPLQVDHINGDGLDNRKKNLRICTRSQNQMNRSAQSNNKSGYKGVIWKKRSQKWVAQIKVNGSVFYGSVTFCVVKAAKEYDSMAKKYFGEFARLNFPEDSDA